MHIFGGIDLREGARDNAYAIPLEGDDKEWKELEIKGEIIGKHSNGGSFLKDNKWYIIGGLISNEQSNNVYALDLDSLECHKIAFKGTKESPAKIPEPMDSHTAVLVSPENKKALIFGGYVGAKKSNKVFEFLVDENKWREIPNKKDQKLPAPRTGHSAVIYNGSMYIFGGSSAECDKLCDFWKYDISNENWSEIKPPEGQEETCLWPRVRSGHSAVIHGTTMYIFGGSLGLTMETNDFMCYNFSSSSWNIIHAAEAVHSIMERNSPVTALKEMKMLEEAKRKNAGDSGSPRLKGFHADFFKKLQDSAIGESPRKKIKGNNESMGASDSSPSKYRSFKRGVGSLSPDRRGEDEVGSPIVLAMKNSVVMMATNVPKGKSPKMEVALPAVHGIVVGSYPCGRDGHAAAVFQDKLFIFGGDRFQMGFNDLYAYGF